jgi:hypothetical protein
MRVTKPLDRRLNISFELGIGGETYTTSIIDDVAEVLLRKNPSAYGKPITFHRLVVLKPSPNSEIKSRKYSAPVRYRIKSRRADHEARRRGSALYAAEIANPIATMIAKSPMQNPATRNAVPSINIALAWPISHWS